VARLYCQQKTLFLWFTHPHYGHRARAPVEFFLAPGAFSDTSALRLYNFDVPVQSWITGDKAYSDYVMEDLMREAGVELLPLRKKNSLRPVPAYMTYLQASIRKIVETTGSLIERLLPKSIHAGNRRRL